MWRSVKPLNSEELSRFESEFSFRIHPQFREFLLSHNAGMPSGATFLTVKTQRKLCWLFDFSESNDPKGAWAINRRLRSKIGPDRIIIGRDQDLNYILLERDTSSSQRVVIWAHTTMDFEACAGDLATFIRFVS